MQLKINHHRPNLWLLKAMISLLTLLLSIKVYPNQFHYVEVEASKFQLQKVYQKLQSLGYFQMQKKNGRYYSYRQELSFFNPVSSALPTSPTPTPTEKSAPLSSTAQNNRQESSQINKTLDPAGDNISDNYRIIAPLIRSICPIKTNNENSPSNSNKKFFNSYQYFMQTICQEIKRKKNLVGLTKISYTENIHTLQETSTNSQYHQYTTPFSTYTSLTRQQEPRNNSSGVDNGVNISNNVDDSCLQEKYGDTLSCLFEFMNDENINFYHINQDFTKQEENSTSPKMVNGNLLVGFYVIDNDQTWHQLFSDEILDLVFFITQIIVVIFSLLLLISFLIHFFHWVVRKLSQFIT